MEVRTKVTLQHLRLLVALADHGGVTAASRAVGISQPAFSEHLRAIERHYGFPLVMRTGRRVVLTRPARVVVDYARRITRLAEESDQAVRQLLELESGRLAVAASPTPGAYLVPRLLADFQVRHPAVEVRLMVGGARVVERWVLRGEADLGVIGEVPEPLDLVSRPVRRDQLVAVMAGSHPLATVARLDGTALASYPLIVREQGSGTRHTLERALALAGLPLRVLFELDGTDAILQAAAAGLGAAVLSELAVGRAALGLRLHERRVVGLELSRHLVVVTHPDAKPGPAASEFIASVERGAEPPARPAA
jgi:DNA-binding transcriptional LysR family regulator